VDPVPDPLPLRKSGSAGNRTRASGSVARNSKPSLIRSLHDYLEAVALNFSRIGLVVFPEVGMWTNPRRLDWPSGPVRTMTTRCMREGRRDA
jgi:hypothetical protein